jgi:hypothetical protein
MAMVSPVIHVSTTAPRDLADLVQTLDAGFGVNLPAAAPDGRESPFTHPPPRSTAHVVALLRLRFGRLRLNIIPYQIVIKIGNDLRLPFGTKMKEV